MIKRSARLELKAFDDPGIVRYRNLLSEERHCCKMQERLFLARSFALCSWASFNFICDLQREKKTKKRCVIDFCSFCNVRAASRPDLRGSAYPPPTAVFNVFDNGIKKYTAHYSFLLFCRVVFPVFISEINNRNMNVTKTRKLLGSTYHSVVIQLKIPKSENQKKRFVISLCVFVNKTK